MRWPEEYRRQLISLLARQPDQMAQAVRAIPEPAWHARRTPADSTVHQLAAHIRDLETLAYGPRLRRVLDEDRPILEAFASHTWSSADYRPDEPLPAILAAFAAARQQSVARLSGLSVDDWGRVGFHAPSGWRTAQWWAERMAHHVREHMAEMMTLKTEDAGERA